MAKTMVLDRENLQKLHRYAYSLTANEADAYDLLQSAIETSLNRPADSVNKTIAYIRMIMKNRFIDDYRHKQSFPLEDIDDHSPVSMDESSLEAWSKKISLYRSYFRSTRLFVAAFSSMLLWRISSSI